MQSGLAVLAGGWLVGWLVGLLVGWLVGWLAWVDQQTRTADWFYFGPVVTLSLPLMPARPLCFGICRRCKCSGSCAAASPMVVASSLLSRESWRWWKNIIKLFGTWTLQFVSCHSFAKHRSIKSKLYFAQNWKFCLSHCRLRLSGSFLSLCLFRMQISCDALAVSRLDTDAMKYSDQPDTHTQNAKR